LVGHYGWSKEKIKNLFHILLLYLFIFFLLLISKIVTKY